MTDVLNTCGSCHKNKIYKNFPLCKDCFRNHLCQSLEEHPYSLSLEEFEEIPHIISDEHYYLIAFKAVLKRLKDKHD